MESPPNLITPLERELEELPTDPSRLRSKLEGSQERLRVLRHNTLVAESNRAALQADVSRLEEQVGAKLGPRGVSGAMALVDSITVTTLRDGEVFHARATAGDLVTTEDAAALRSMHPGRTVHRVSEETFAELQRNGRLTP